MDNGYSKWLEKRKDTKLKRKYLFLKLCIPSFLLMALIFIFGYDTSMFDKNKLIEFILGCIGIFILIIIITVFRYKLPKFVPICNKCGKEIKNVKSDCVIGNVEYLGTEDKVIYKKSKTTVKGKTVHPRGGYSMRNSVLEHTSETNYEINQDIPLVQKVHVYNISYACKNCGEIFCNYREESVKPIHF